MTLTYLGIVLVLWAVDATFCASARRRFHIWRSLAMNLLWPVTLPVIVFGTAWITRNMPDFDISDLRKGRR